MTLVNFENLINLAIHHKKYCTQSDCNVMLFPLLNTFMDITKLFTNVEERNKAIQLILDNKDAWI